MMINYLPQYFSSRAIGLYLILLFYCSCLFLNYRLPVEWIFFGIAEVIIFFHFSSVFTKKWADVPEKLYLKKLFNTALWIRIIYVLFSYFFYNFKTGQPFEFSAADSTGYHEAAAWFVDLVKAREFNYLFGYMISTVNISDMGYPIYLTGIYLIFGKHIIVPRLFKAAIGAYTVLLIYKIARRNFGEGPAKIAGVMAMLLPNLIYYCGLHVKETEMVFLTVAFIERADLLLRENRINIKVLITTILLGLSLFFFRTVLAVVAISSLLAASVFSSSRFIWLGKRMTILFLVAVVAYFMAGEQIRQEVSRYWGERFTNQQWGMSQIARGNRLATYGKKTVFASVALLAPFPTLVNIENQQNQMLLNGGFYTRNVYVFFVLIALIYLIRHQRYRHHILILSFFSSYLTVLIMSRFALSERFHLPTLPFLIMLAAYGITQINHRSDKNYDLYLFLVAIVIIGWNWFKLSGRGLM